MKTEKSRQTHNEIIEAAKALFMIKSVNRVTVNDIAEKAGIAKGTFYLHFASKDELVWHFVEHQFSPAFDWLGRIETMGYSEQDIRWICVFIVDYVSKNIDVLKMLHHIRFYSYLGKENMKDEYFAHIAVPVRAWLEKGRIEGKLDISDSEFLAVFLITSIHELVDLFIEGRVKWTKDAFVNNMHHVLVKILK